MGKETDGLKLTPAQEEIKEELMEDLIEDDEIELNKKQEKFAILYSSDRDFYGNGVQSYIEAYEPDQKQKNWYKTACSAASRLLSNVKVCKRINELLDESGLNDAFVDKQLLNLITQHSEKSVKMSAIKHYNDLKARVKVRIEHSGEIANGDLKGVSTEALLKERKRIEDEAIEKEKEKKNGQDKINK